MLCNKIVRHLIKSRLLRKLPITFLINKNLICNFYFQEISICIKNIFIKDKQFEKNINLSKKLR